MTIYKGDDTVRLSGEATDRDLTGVASAWMNFDHATNTIGDSINTSSVTDTATGRYAHNLTNSMDNILFTVSGIAGTNTGGTADFICPYGVWTVSQVQLCEYNYLASLVDRNHNTISHHGDLA